MFKIGDLVIVNLDTVYEGSYASNPEELEKYELGIGKVVEVKQGGYPIEVEWDKATTPGLYFEEELFHAFKQLEIFDEQV